MAKLPSEALLKSLRALKRSMERIEQIEKELQEVLDNE